MSTTPWFSIKRRTGNARFSNNPVFFPKLKPCKIDRHCRKLFPLAYALYLSIYFAIYFFMPVWGLAILYINQLNQKPVVCFLRDIWTISGWTNTNDTLSSVFIGVYLDTPLTKRIARGRHKLILLLLSAVSLYRRLIVFTTLTFIVNFSSNQDWNKGNQDGW